MLVTGLAACAASVGYVDSSQVVGWTRAAVCCAVAVALLALTLRE